MPQEYLKGFVVAQDSVHGKPMWKVRISQKGHSLFNKKCRVMSVHDGYVPQQGDDVRFVLGTTREGQQIINLAFDLSPAVDERIHVQKPGEGMAEDSDTMNWVVTQFEGKLNASCIGDVKLLEGELAYSDEKIVAYIPFDIADHLGRFDEDDVESGFEVIRALTCVPATRDALEKIITAIVRETAHQVKIQSLIEPS